MTHAQKHRQGYGPSAVQFFLDFDQRLAPPDGNDYIPVFGLRPPLGSTGDGYVFI